MREPIMMDVPAIDSLRHAENGSAGRMHRRHSRERAVGMIEIGLLNNMPDQALRATERQFAALIEAAAEPRAVRVRRFFLPDLPRGDVARAYLQAHYEEASALCRGRLDALIVTGQEPRAARLQDEPYWGSLTNIIDWAQDNTIAAVWSCLAAHAAVLHLDGIERQRLATKLCGVFDCEKAEENRLLAGIGGMLAIPHSRHNGLREGDLARKGYRILTRSSRTGADMFIKNGRSLSVFFQGHPEYEVHSLLGEYRRDVGRFLRSEVAAYPVLPQGYFDERSRRLLIEFTARACSDRRPGLLAEFPETNISGNASARWWGQGVAIFRNWLDYIVAAKTMRSQAAILPA